MRIVLLILASMLFGIIVAALLPIQTRNADMVTPDLTPTQDDLDRAALDNLSPLPHPSALYPLSDAECDDVQAWIDRHRQWIATIQDRRARNAYARWVDYVEYCLGENREENRTHKRQKEFEEYERRTAAENERARAIRPSLPTPPR